MQFMDRSDKGGGKDDVRKQEEGKYSKRRKERVEVCNKTKSKKLERMKTLIGRGGK